MELCRVSSGGTPSRQQSAYWHNGTIPWVKTGELHHNIIMETEEKITEQGLNNSSAKLYPKGSILVAMYGATIGQTAKLGIEATTNQACAVLFDFKQIVESDFIWEYLKTQTEKLKKLGYGAAQQNLNASLIANYVISAPSLTEQQKILAKIAEYEAQIAACEQKIQSLPAQKQAILAKYLQGA